MPRPLSTTARAKMIASAQHLLVSHGLDRCTIDEVARHSGVAKTTVYRHFGDANELVVAAIHELMREIEIPDHGSLHADLRAVVDASCTLLPHEPFRRLFSSMLNRAVNDREFAALHDATQENRHVALRIVLQRGIARGEVDPELDIETAVYLVQGPIVAKRLIESVDLTDREIDTLIERSVRALAP